MRLRAVFGCPSREREAQFHLHALRRSHRLARLRRFARPELRGPWRALQLAHESARLPAVGRNSCRQSHSPRIRLVRCRPRRRAELGATRLLKNYTRANGLPAALVRDTLRHSPRAVRAQVSGGGEPGSPPPRATVTTGVAGVGPLPQLPQATRGLRRDFNKTAGERVLHLEDRCEHRILGPFRRVGLKL